MVESITRKKETVSVNNISRSKNDEKTLADAYIQPNKETEESSLQSI